MFCVFYTISVYLFLLLCDALITCVLGIYKLLLVLNHFIAIIKLNEILQIKW